MGLLNGLSAMGASLAQYAGAAGLEAQKADLAKQSLQLADQLQGARESAGRQEAGAIAATAAGKQQEFEAGQNVLQRKMQVDIGGMQAGATLGAAGIAAGASKYSADSRAAVDKYMSDVNAGTSRDVAKISADAGAGLRAAQARDADAKANLSSAELAKVNVVTGLQQNLADEYAKPTPDPVKIKSLGDQISAQGLTASTRAGVLTSLDSLAKTEGQNVSLLTHQLSEETDKLGGMMLDPDQKARQQHVVDDLKQQLDASRARQQSLMDQARSVMPGGSSAPSRMSSPAAGTVSDSASSGGLINATKPSSPATSSPATPGDATAAPASSAAPTDTAPVKPGAAPPAKLPGDVGGLTNLDAIKTARPELNTDVLKGRSPAVTGLVMQIIDGRATLPPLGSRNPDAMMLRALASQVDPTLDEASSKSRMATRVSFTAGQEARAISSLNMALGHAGEAAKDFDALDNGSIPAWNWLVNNKRSELNGEPEKGNAQMAINSLAAEARKVFSGSNSAGSLTELKEWQDSFPLNGSRDQQRGALNQFVNLLDSRLQSLGDQYNRGMGVTRDPMTFLEPHAQQVMQQLTGNAPSVPVGNQLGNPSRPGTARPAAASVPAQASAPAAQGMTREQAVAQARREIDTSGVPYPPDLYNKKVTDRAQALMNAPSAVSPELRRIWGQ